METIMKEQKNLQIEGMSCDHCKMSVQLALADLPNVKKARVDLKKREASVTLTDTVSDEKLIKAVEDAGYKAVIVSSA